MLSVLDAIHGRQSVRAFLPDKHVDRCTITRILAAGARAPNGSNIQPWRVTVLMGDALGVFTTKIKSAYYADCADVRDYSYYMQDWREPYIGRRRQTGWGLYSHVGIEKGDRAASQAQQARNYEFFSAPVGLIITMDRDMGQGAWLDLGAFIQTLLLASRGEGLEACPIAAFCNYPNLIRSLLDIDASSVIVTGMAIGHPDRSARINSFRTPRLPPDRFAVFLDSLPQVQAAE